MLEQAAEGIVRPRMPSGWGYRYHIPRTTALAVRGVNWRGSRHARRAGQGAASVPVARLRMQLGPGVGGREPGRRQRGDHRRAVGGRKGAAATGNSQPKWSVCRPPPSSGTVRAHLRLRELEGIVEGPRVGVAARFAEALRDGDAAQLASVSEEFERLGDLVAAVDAAAQAALDVSTAKAFGDRRWDARHAPTRWPNNAAAQYSGASSGRRALAADRSGTRDRDADR